MILKQLGSTLGARVLTAAAECAPQAVLSAVHTHKVLVFQGVRWSQPEMVRWFGALGGGVPLPQRGRDSARGECDEIRNSMAELKSEHEKILAELSQLKASVAVANALGFARFADSALRLSRESSTVAPHPTINLLSSRSLE